MLENLYQKAQLAKAENAKLLKRLAKGNTAKLDKDFRGLHEAVFSEINCLDCGNCCRLLGPRIAAVDIDRMAKALKQRPAVFIENYLHIDEDGDYVFKAMPCPFLAEDNYCSIYASRPRACTEYPHTDRKRIYQILDITLKNSFTCPAVFEILERLKKR